MFEIFEPLSPYLPLITVGLAVFTLWNAIKTRIQGNELKKQNLALKRIDREDKFRYLHPHLYVDFIAKFPYQDSSYTPTCVMIVSNRDERNVRVDTVEWAYDDGFSWALDNVDFQPVMLQTSDKIEISINPEAKIFPHSSGKPLDMIANILGLSIKVKLSTDAGRLYSIDDHRFKRYLMCRYIDSAIMLKVGEYFLCRQYKLSLLNLLI
ncbi:hypothetical protein [Salinivibrio sp. ES.052]|uniref:hypothetical protein n=1 Tax=Salinivibrio sp. ES.052 TaxID=1882823 RepID=UPI000925C207|nr:hypothetical protein [Salinivibrio sp. ES.052]SIO33208.1 hypothetical protein SAMN05444724_2749 [Salinivibrio sp. ES.052]